MEIQLVTGRDPARADELAEFLAHKGYPWVRHTRDCLEGRAEGMAADWYMGRVDGRLAGNVVLFRNDYLGNVSHVYVAEDMRRRKIATRLLEAAVADFEKQQGRILVLGAGFQTPQWRLYESFGFSGVCPEQRYGGMVRFLGNWTWETVMTGPARGVRTMDWRDYVGLQVLFGQPAPDQVRSLHFPSIGPRLTEREFLHFVYRQQAGEPLRAWVIPGDGPAVLGCALLGTHPVWGALGLRQVLDFHVHPAGWDTAASLLETALAAAAGPVECHLDSASERRIALLREHGFLEHRLPASLTDGHGELDWVMLTRRKTP